VRDDTGFGDELTGTQVPPEIRVSHRAQGHDENTEEEKDKEGFTDSEAHGVILS